MSSQESLSQTSLTLLVYSEYTTLQSQGLRQALLLVAKAWFLDMS